MQHKSKRKLLIGGQTTFATFSVPHSPRTVPRSSNDADLSALDAHFRTQTPLVGRTDRRAYRLNEVNSRRRKMTETDDEREEKNSAAINRILDRTAHTRIIMERKIAHFYMELEEEALMHVVLYLKSRLLASII